MKPPPPIDICMPFPAAAPMMVAGPTGCGKTSWVYKLLRTRNKNFTQPVESILYCYGVYQRLYTDMQRNLGNITFHSGLPSKDMVDELNTGKHHVIVLDDLMELIVESIQAQNLFTKFCHHYNITTIFLTQNALAQGKCARTIGLNTLILVLFQNHRDRNQAYTLARQQAPQNLFVFLDAFEDATKRLHGYMVVDCTPECNDNDRWRTNIFSDDPPPKRYLRDYGYMTPCYKPEGPLFQPLICHKDNHEAITRKTSRTKTVSGLHASRRKPRTNGRPYDGNHLTSARRSKRNRHELGRTNPV